MFCLRSSIPGLSTISTALNVVPSATFPVKNSVCAIKTLGNETVKAKPTLKAIPYRGVDVLPATVNTLSGLGSIRMAHTDIQPPTYQDSDRHPNWRQQTNREDRNAENALPSYMLLGTGMGLTMYMAKYALYGVAVMIGPARDKLAAASIEVDLNSIPEGKNVTIKWRGKPLFIRHRTPAEIESVKNSSMAEFRDPEEDSIRCQNEKFLIVIGICTHLGCVPISHAGDWGGYYCPCHGSHYDNSGRIMKGPAPFNLEIPDYEFISDSTVLVGRVD